MAARIGVKLELDKGSWLDSYGTLGGRLNGRRCAITKKTRLLPGRFFLFILWSLAPLPAPFSSIDVYLGLMRKAR